MPETRLSVAAVAAALGPYAARFDLDVVEECESTNTLLLARAGTGAGVPAGTVVAARRQTAGRGRMGRAWHGDEASSLAFSILWRLPGGASPSGLSLAAGVAVAEALLSLGIDGIALKWPNDILREGRKLAGILVELSGSAAVIGIGLNVRLPEELPPEVSRGATALDRDIDRNALLAALLISLHGVLERFGTRGFEALRDRWQALNAYAGSPVSIVSGFAPPLEGICAGVDTDGALLLQTGAGIERVISGDVSLRPGVRP